MSALLLVVMMMSDTSEIERVCGGMVEAWYGGDAEKMESVLHPDLAKRGVLTDEKGSPVIRFADKAQMVEGARRGVGRIPREQWAIETTVLDRHETMATVRVVSVYLIDVCQVAKVDGRWRIVNVLWTTRGTPPWSTSRPSPPGSR